MLVRIYDNYRMYEKKTNVSSVTPDNKCFAFVHNNLQHLSTRAPYLTNVNKRVPRERNASISEYLVFRNHDKHSLITLVRCNEATSGDNFV